MATSWWCNVAIIFLMQPMALILPQDGLCYLNSLLALAYMWSCFQCLSVKYHPLILMDFCTLHIVTIQQITWEVQPSMLSAKLYAWRKVVDG